MMKSLFNFEKWKRTNPFLRRIYAKQTVDSLKKEIENYVNQNYILIYYQGAEYGDDEEYLSLECDFKEELEQVLQTVDKTFSEKLLEWIVIKKLNEVDCYKKAGVDRKLFSKIKSNKHYHPSRDTVISFALALQLNLDETDDLLEKAGYSFSCSSSADLIIMFFIEKGIYDPVIINEALYQFHEQIIGNFK